MKNRKGMIEELGNEEDWKGNDWKKDGMQIKRKNGKD